MTRATSSVQRLHVTADLQTDAIIEMDTKQAHYLRNVLRLEAGGELLLFNGRDGEWRAELETVSKKLVLARAVNQMRAQDAPSDIWLLVAPVKKERLDYLAQKATEMGAGKLVPVLTKRTQGSRLNKDKLLANTIEAAEQCNIMSLPEVGEAVRLDRLLADWASLGEGRQIVFCDEAAACGTGARELDALKGKKLALLIGPEGGFDEAERADLLARDDTLALSLGPRILRTDTAVVAALALVQSRLGDW
jgi:16S rRNA (uracil1498-N3)-methyltransferase